MSDWVWVTPLKIMFSSFIHLPAKFKKSLFFFCCIVVHCINVPHFPYPFFGQRAFRLYPGTGYDKQCSHEYCGMTEHPLYIYTQKWYYWVLRKVVFPIFWEISILASKGVVTACTPTRNAGVPLTQQSLQHKLSSVFWILPILTGVRWNLSVILICISLLTKMMNTNWRLLWVDLKERW